MDYTGYKYRTAELENIVARSADGDALVTWNGGATFNIFVADGSGTWDNVHAFTHYGIETDTQAAESARESLAEWLAA